MNPAISSFVPPVAPQMPQAQAPAASPSQPGFSQMLSQAQAREAEAPPADAGPDAGAPPKPAQASERAQKGEKAGKAEKADKGRTAEPEARADKTGRAEGEGEAVDSADSAEKAEAETQAADPALADWLASLQRPVAAPPAEAAKGQATEGDELADTAVASPKGGARGALPAAAGKDVKAQDAAEEARGLLKAKPESATRDAAENPSFKAALAQADEGRRELKPVQELHAPHAAVGTAPTHGASRSGDVAAPVAVQVPTPATSPEFTKELGLQVSVLAKDGIQQAELHLNPAEMGPISIQIAIDGSQAQVNFGADSAATRQIIESGLPELAASLREAGFTLSGGGVHSQARGREQGEGGRDGDGSGPRAIGGVETDVTPRRVVSRVSAGGVDLYA